MGSLKKHDSILERIARRLSYSGKYDWVARKVEYEHGEMDILASRNDQWFYFEIKSCKGMRRYGYACEQVHRAQQYFPDKNIKGVFISSTHIKRIH